MFYSIRNPICANCFKCKIGKNIIRMNVTMSFIFNRTKKVLSI